MRKMWKIVDGKEVYFFVEDSEEWKQKERERARKTSAVKIQCECGAIIRYGSKYGHERSKKHLEKFEE